MVASGRPLWEQSVRWPGAGLPFDMRSLRFVLAAAEQLSFSAAAAALDTRVSTVSRRIRDLEDELGVALFERNNAGVRLTNAGERLVKELIPAIRQVETALYHASSAGRVESGTVRIGIITTLAGGFLRELISRFRSGFDGVQIEIHDGGRREHLQALRSRALDIAFFTGNAPIAGCDVEELWCERVHVAMAAGHPLASHIMLDWPDLREERFIVSTHEPGPEVHDYIIRRVADYSTYPDVGFRPVIHETLMQIASIGEGITLVSQGWTGMSFPDLVLRPLTSPEDIVPFSAVWSPNNDNPALRRFISFARVLAVKWREDRTDH